MDFPEGDVEGSLAAAGLHKSSRLIESALVHAEADVPAGIGVLVRSAFEYWLCATYALVGGKDACFGLELERYGQQVFPTEIATTKEDDPDRRAAMERQTADFRSEQEMYAAEAKRWLDRELPKATNRDQIARRLGSLIHARFEPGADPIDVLGMYDTLYRSHSTMDVHPPLTMNQLTSMEGRVDVDRQP